MIKSSEIKYEFTLTQGNRLYIECLNKQDAYKYTFAFFKGEKKVDHAPYSHNTSAICWLSEPGEYWVRIGVCDEKGEKVFTRTHKLIYEGRTIVMSSQKRHRRFGWLINTGAVLKEIWQNRKRMLRIAKYDYNIQDKDAYLGKFWSVLSPLIQIFTYWFVFGIGIKKGEPINGYPYMVWLLCGMLPWFFISKCITRGAGSVYAKANVALRLRYPVSTIPVGSVIVELFEHFMMMAVFVVVMLFYNVTPNINWLNMIYYVVYSVVFLSALAMITSTLTMIARDFQFFISSIIRLLFFITPILWSTENLSDTVQSIFRLNPFLYIVDGYRDSILYGVAFWQHYNKLWFFWLLNIVLIIIGCNIQKRFKDRFLDLM